MAALVREAKWKVVERMSLNEYPLTTKKKKKTQTEESNQVPSTKRSEKCVLYLKIIRPRDMNKLVHITVFVKD